MQIVIIVAQSMLSGVFS